MTLGLRLGIGVVCAGIMASALLAHAGNPEPPDTIGGLPYVGVFDRTPVAIDVFVRDAKGDPVTGLTAGQFRLFQDDVEIPISSFTAFTRESSSGPAASGEATEDTARGGPAERASAAEARPVYIILYIDSQNLRTGDRTRVLQSLRRFVTDVLKGPVRIMVVNHYQSIEILQPFTDDPRAVIETLRALRVADATRDERDEAHDDLQQEIRRFDKHRNTSQTGRQQALSDLYAKIRTFVEEENVLLDRSLSAIREMTSALTGIPGRKHLVYVSNGLPMVLAKDLLYEYGGLDPRASDVTVSTAYDRKRHYEAVATAASSQEVTVHTVDATGTSLPPPRIGDSDSPRSSTARMVARDNNQASLRLMADLTGGLAVVGTDDFGAELNRVAANVLTYYSVGYTIESPGADTVHHIRVELESQEQLEVRYRSSFVEKSMQARVQDEATAGLFFDIGGNPLGIEVAADRQVKATESRWLQPVTVFLPVSSLAMTREGADYVGRAVVFVAMREQTGRNMDVQRQVHDFRLAADEYDQRKHDRFIVILRLLMESGRHTIVIGVLDETTHQTSFERLETVSPDQV